MHQRPAGFLEVRHDVVAAPLAVAALRRRPLMDSTTIPFPAVEDHVVLALADKFHVVIGAWFRTRHDQLNLHARMLTSRERGVGRRSTRCEEMIVWTEDTLRAAGISTTRHARYLRRMPSPADRR